MAPGSCSGTRARSPAKAFDRSKTWAGDNSDPVGAGVAVALVRTDAVGLVGHRVGCPVLANLHKPDPPCSPNRGNHYTFIDGDFLEGPVPRAFQGGTGVPRWSLGTEGSRYGRTRSKPFRGLRNQDHGTTLNTPCLNSSNGAIVQNPLFSERKARRYA